MHIKYRKKRSRLLCTLYTWHKVHKPFCFSLAQTTNIMFLPFVDCPKRKQSISLESVFYIQQVYFLYPTTIYNSLSFLHLLLHANTLSCYLVFSIKEILYLLGHHSACDIKYSFMCILIKVLKMKFYFDLPKNLET